MRVLLQVQSLGADAGPNFQLTTNVGSVSPSIATKSQLVSGIEVTVTDNATTITIASLGACSSSSTVSIVNDCVGEPTATPTATPTETPIATPTPTATPIATPAGPGILPAGASMAQADPFFSLQRMAACPNNNQRPFWAQWEDNGSSCINKMLFVHLKTPRYELSVYHTNKIVPSIQGSVIDSVEIVYNGQSTVYNSTSELNTILGGDISIQLTSSSFESLSFLQMSFGWIRQINDVTTLGGGIGVVLKKVIEQGGYWQSPTGPTINGFEQAGAFLNITRLDLELAASSGPNTPEWNKVMFAGSDFNALNIGPTCRQIINRPWDPAPLAFFNNLKRIRIITYNSWTDPCPSGFYCGNDYIDSYIPYGDSFVNTCCANEFPNDLEDFVMWFDGSYTADVCLDSQYDDINLVGSTFSVVNAPYPDPWAVTVVGEYFTESYECYYEFNPYGGDTSGFIPGTLEFY